MRLCQATLREIQMPLVRPFETSFGRTTDRRILLVEVDADGVTGWGECVAGERPSYSPETIETAWLILRDFIWPALARKEFSAAADVWEILSPIRGHNMAKAAIEAAAWDAEARQKNLPLWKLLGGTLHEIPCGVSIGIQENDEELERVVENELAAGYQRIKIKIKPGYDVEPVARLRRRFPRIRLTVDANSAYTLEDASAPARTRRLLPDDDRAAARMGRHLEPRRVAAAAPDADLPRRVYPHRRTRARGDCVGAGRIINMKLGRVGGFTPARRIHDLCLEHGIPVWCGGMLESGIGRAHNIALSTLADFTLPGDVTASKRYWTEDIIDPEVTVTPQGTIHVPRAAGIGYEPRRERIEQLTVRREVLR